MKDNLTGFYQAAEAEYEIRCDDFFKDWVPNNQSVIDGFLQVANKIRSEFGREHYGAQAAYEILRYHTMERDNSNDFKLNNNNVAMLSRYVMAKYPQLDGFFSLRNISGLPEEIAKHIFKAAMTRSAARPPAQAVLF